MELMQIIELVAATIGILYVWLEMKASVWLWPVGIVLPLFYIYISWQSEVYGNVLVNIYYIIACVWGWREWLKHRKDGETKELPISHLPERYLWTLGLVALLFLGLWPLFETIWGALFPLLMPLLPLLASMACGFWERSILRAGIAGSRRMRSIVPSTSYNLTRSPAYSLPSTP